MNICREERDIYSEAKERAIVKLKRDLGRDICAALEDKETIEVMLNPDGSLWQEKLRQAPCMIGQLGPFRGEAIIKNVASFFDKVVTTEQPTVEEVLPFDGSRFAGQIPPIVQRATFAIRKQAQRIFTLQDFMDGEAITTQQLEALEKLVLEHKNILVVGGTGSGKTTLANAIINKISELYPNERLSIIEDTAEIQCAAPNQIRYLTTANIKMSKLLSVVLRMRPDRVIVGEVRGEEALDLLDAWNVGHTGGVATIHANTTDLALRRLKSCVSRNPTAPADIESYIGDVLDVIIHIEKNNAKKSGRAVSEIKFVTSYDGEKYITESI